MSSPAPPLDAPHDAAASPLADAPTDSNDALIRTVDVRVDYGNVTAVRDLNLSIARGEIYGLIGPNGAGKTSTIRVLATLQEPTYGDVYIAGLDVSESPRGIHHRLGYMRDLPPTYDDLKCWEFLDVVARQHAMPREQRADRIAELLDLVNLSGKRDAMAGTLSRGMKQRLSLAKILLHDPQVLLLDEPASGLDPIARIELRDILKAEAAAGKTILISSHILTELEEFCTSVGVMQKGRMILNGRLDEIREQLTVQRRVDIHLLEPDEAAAAFLEAHDHVLTVERVNPTLVRCAVDLDPAGVADLLSELIADGHRLIGFREQRVDLEQIIIHTGAREVS